MSRIEMPKRARSYIQRLRDDPRTRAMFDGWVAQATVEAEQRFPDPYDCRQAAHHAAQTALQLAMSFVLDNDGELLATQEELDRLREQIIEGVHLLPPRPLIVAKG